MSTHHELPGGKGTLPRKRRSRPYRETPEVVEATCRIVRSLGKRIATEDPDSLALLVRLDDERREAWTRAIAGLRRSGFTDSEIGKALGVSRQAVEQRWPRGEKP